MTDLAKAEQGIHKISMADYLALPYLSSGLCNTLLTCSPYHAKFERDNRVFDDNEASDTGTAIHDALLEGINRIVNVDAKDWRTNAAKEAREVARAAGKIPILQHKIPQVQAAVEAAKDYIAGSELAGVFDSGEPEQTIIWRECISLGGVSSTVIDLKARPDWLTADRSIMLHVKTTKGSAEPESWIRRQLVGIGYDVAAMFYKRGAIALDETPAFNRTAQSMNSVFLVIEQNPPYGCSLIALSPAMAEIASAKVERAIRTWAQCKASGKWPCYSAQIAYAEPTAWQFSEAEQSMLTEKELEGGIPL